MGRKHLLKLLFVRREGKTPWRRGGGIVRSGQMIKAGLQKLGGVDVVTASDKAQDPLPEGTDLIWVYADFVNVPYYAELARKAGIPILINSSFDGTGGRARQIISYLNQWDPDGHGHVYLNTFSHSAEYSPSLRKIRSQLVAIPQPLRQGRKNMRFNERKGICIGDLGKTFQGRLNYGFDVREAIEKLLRKGYPLTAYTQYRVPEDVPEGVQTVEYRYRGFVESLSQYRLFLCLIQHETFAMVPLEAQSVGTPVLYRYMPQSLSQYIGHTGLMYRTMGELLDGVDVLYENPQFWKKYSEASLHNIRARNYRTLSTALTMALRQVVLRYRAKLESQESKESTR